MSTSNVRNIDSLAALHSGMLRLAHDWDNTVQELSSFVQRAEEHFSQTQPRYWRRQTQLAERELNEAKDNLARKRASIRIEDRPAASEAVARVQKAERRLRVCEDKTRQLRSWANEVAKACDGLRGPLADVHEHCDTILPQAARELATLIDQLRQYAEQARQRDSL
ncbi:hypothetical protein Pla52o_38160 [Novipirellula galeiformis]|uniref:Chromosome partition protein Smc n=1 Tax=Novipirellula galeiformis TaxID=2528004 RepID=A0A5C6CFZ5_9BACT|nr:hypothetical protein [Novipirellula galeiformis]TWU21629.1 hypothetical protein Pla52o_38160 [Novipirellula galeiformis]